MVLKRIIIMLFFQNANSQESDLNILRPKVQRAICLRSDEMIHQEILKMKFEFNCVELRLAKVKLNFVRYYIRLNVLLNYVVCTAMLHMLLRCVRHISACASIL